MNTGSRIKMDELQDLKSLYDFSYLNITDEMILSDIEQLVANNTISPMTVKVSKGILALFIILYGSISLLAIIGNSLVILVVLRLRTMRTITNIFIANMAIADVSIALFSIPFQFHTAVFQRWVVADSMCKIAPFVKDLSVNISVLTLTVIAIDRYIAVIYPLKAGFRKRVAVLVITAIWVVGIASSLPDIVFFDVKITFDVITWNRRPICDSKWPSKTFASGYSLYLFLLQYFIPLLIISVTYCRIVCTIWGRNNSASEIGRCHRSRTRHKKKVVKMLIIVTSLFAFCWLPLQTYNLLNAFYRKINRFRYINIIWFCSNWLAMSNSCYNPFIYGLLNEKFQQEFKNLFKCHQICKRMKFGRHHCLTSTEVTSTKTSHFYQSLTLSRRRSSGVKTCSADSKKEGLHSKWSGISQKSNRNMI